MTLNMARTLRGFPPPGGAEDHVEASKETVGWWVRIPPNSGSAKGSGGQLDGGVHPMEVENNGTVHHHPAHNGPFPGSGEVPGG